MTQSHDHAVATEQRLARLERIIQNLMAMLLRHGVILSSSPYFAEIDKDIEAIQSEHQTTRDAGG